MIRERITEVNFTSHFWAARRYMPAELNILLTVFLAPMDPRVPYAAGRWHAPAIYHRLFPPGLVRLLSTPRLNLNFHTHLANSPSEYRRGEVRDSEDTPFKARSWLTSEFDKFKAKFKQVVELSWNNQIILIPPEDPKEGLGDDDYMEMVMSSNPRLPAHVVCSLTLFLVQSQQHANAQIQVVRLDRNEELYAARRDEMMARPGEGQFRSYTLLLTNEDVYRRDTTSYRWPNVHFSQIGAAHEIGHWLARPLPTDDQDRFLDHIDESKYPKTHPEHDELQYGGTAGHRAALMGGGSFATAYDAGPWLNRARRHTKALFGWQFVHRSRFVGIVPVSARQARLVGGP